MNQADEPSSRLQKDRCATHRISLLLAVTMVGLLVGCGSSSKLVSEENDKLRADNMQLHRELQKLHASVKAKADKLQALESSTTPPADPDAQIPQVTSIKFGRYCTALDQDGDGHDDLIRLYILTLDQLKRFIPVAGTATVQVDHLLPGQKPLTLATRSFDAKTLDEAYRSNITGTHYTLDVPLPKDDTIKNVNQVTVSLLITDLQYGTKFNEQIALPIKP